ncbi:cellulose-binding protein [Streptomyces sp. SUK 48]|uniref:cellulose-binding protein n=1 Tax=Streptomyces sp. SUK 48 TaxID=2582831 RepID=UPI00129A4C6F|nr:cellulose-binding protein [Streptomyces sp. SUK 48]
MPPNGFATGRGRGYRPEQVEAYLEALSGDRDAAWERAARLTVLAKNMAAEAARLREVVARLRPQEYDTLDDGARRLYQLALEEARQLGERARCEARAEIARAASDAEGVRLAAQADADAVRAEADERARRLLLAAGAEADDLRVGARRAVREGRKESLEALREVRRRTADLLAERSRERAEYWAGAERAETGEAAALDVRDAERVTRAEEETVAAERALAEAEEYGRRCEEEAHARAATIVAEAHARADRIAQETERVLREHSAAWEDVQAHMDHVRGKLTALTGQAVVE